MKFTVYDKKTEKELAGDWFFDQNFRLWKMCQLDGTVELAKSDDGFRIVTYEEKVEIANPDGLARVSLA